MDVLEDTSFGDGIQEANDEAKKSAEAFGALEACLAILVESAKPRPSKLEALQDYVGDHEWLEKELENMGSSRHQMSHSYIHASPEPPGMSYGLGTLCEVTDEDLTDEDENC